MRTIDKSAETSFSAQQMYDLINHIESYPEYLPWCHETIIHHRTDREVNATIKLKKGGINQSFSTHNKMEPNKKIEFTLLEGPFRHLQGQWLFNDLPTSGSRVSFHLEFVFSSKILDLTVGPMLESIANTFVDAFCDRAEKIYKKNV